MFFSNLFIPKGSGLYLTKDQSGKYYNYFNDGVWYLSGETKEEATEYFSKNRRSLLLNSGKHKFCWKAENTFVWKTLVYTNSFPIGSYWNTTVHYKHVKWYEGDTLNQVEVRNGISEYSTVFIFDGKCKSA